MCEDGWVAIQIGDERGMNIDMGGNDDPPDGGGGGGHGDNNGSDGTDPDGSSDIRPNSDTIGDTLAIPPDQPQARLCAIGYRERAIKEEVDRIVKAGRASGMKIEQWCWFCGGCRCHLLMRQDEANGNQINWFSDEKGTGWHGWWRHTTEEGVSTYEVAFNCRGTGAKWLGFGNNCREYGGASSGQKLEGIRASLA